MSGTSTTSTTSASARLRTSRSWRVLATLVGGGLGLTLLRVVHDANRAVALGVPYAWWRLTLDELPYWIVWTVCAWGLVALAERAVVRRVPPQRHLVHSAGVLVVLLLLVPVLYLPGYGHWPVPLDTAYLQTYVREVLGGLSNNVLVFASVSGTAYGVFYYRQARELGVAAARANERLALARMDALRAQLNPHFLFNAMNSVAMLARSGASDDAVRVIASLSDLLRYVLDDRRPQRVPLREELDFVRQYLAVEQIRFGDRLRVELDVPDALADVEVPTLALHTLVDNAVRHGVSRRPGVGVVHVRATRMRGRLVLTVSDTGPGLATPGVRGSGVGLANTRARLAALYGDAASLDVTDRIGDDGTVAGACATLVVPYDVANDVVDFDVPRESVA